MNILSCNDTASTASLSLLLPSHDINLQIQLAGINTIGDVRISLQGSGVEMENDTLNAVYTLIDLTYAQSLSMNGRILTQQPSCIIQLTKVIDRTYPLEADGETQFSGLWLPTFIRSLDQMFVDANEYQYPRESTDFRVPMY